MRPVLRKSSNYRLCGVCGGLAEYFDVDSTLVREAWAIGALVGLPFFGYIVLAIMMPESL